MFKKRVGKLTQLLQEPADESYEAQRGVPTPRLPARSPFAMIQLTRLNNHPLMVNSDLIKFVEKAPDTVLTLVTGEKIVVLETSDDVLTKIIEFRQTILSGARMSPSGPAIPEHAADTLPDAEMPTD